MPIFLPCRVIRRGFPPPISCTARTNRSTSVWCLDARFFCSVLSLMSYTLPGASVGGHQLELTCQGRPVSLMFPEDSAGRAGIGDEVPHLGRRKFRRIIPVGVERLAVHMGRNWESGPRKAGWGDVLEQERRVVARFRTYFGRVANDEGGRTALRQRFLFYTGGKGYWTQPPTWGRIRPCIRLLPAGLWGG